MNRSIQLRFVAFSVSLLVTFALVDSIADYAVAPRLAQPVVVASISR
jgi:hypothetical protein